MNSQKKDIKKVTNRQKNFIYECQICYQDYDNQHHKPMIICSNFHALCLQCVNSNLFKMEYNDKKNPTGRYMCYMCSEIVDKTFVREHHILKEVCNYINNIKQKDQEMRKDYYNYVGSMGMNLVAMREDFGSIEKSNILFKRENEELLKENCRLRQEYSKIERASGAYEQLQKVMRQVQEFKETLQLERVKLLSLNEQIAKRNNEIQQKKDESLKLNQRFFQIQTELNFKRQELNRASKKSLQLMEQNQGAINLKEYLEQEINNLQNEKKKLTEENTQTKRKIELGINKMQSYWDSLLKNSFDDVEDDKPSKSQIVMKKIEEKPIKENVEKVPVLSRKREERQPAEEKHQPSKIIAEFDEIQKSIKNFFIDHNTVTLTNSRLTSFTHISFANPFNLNSDHSFKIKINRMSSRQIIIGLMTPECKNKKNIYNKNGFYGYDGWGKMWIDGNSNDRTMPIRQGDQVKVTYVMDNHQIIWQTSGDMRREIHRLEMKYKKLFPVVMMIDDEDEFEVIEVI